MNTIAFPKPSHKRTKDKITKLQLQSDKSCWVCHSTQLLDPHHIFGGNANRKKSEDYGLVVWLCREHHTGQEKGHKGVHYNKPLMDRLHEFGKSEFVKVYSEELFYKEFKGRYI